MPKCLTPQQVLDRETFVLNHIRANLSRKQVQALICVEFKVLERNAARIYNAAVDNIIERDPQELRRNRAVMLEILQHQASASQNDL